jgi:4-amino-4-deoxy-L-arabinose transferase-like glycosyltransferase
MQVVASSTESEHLSVETPAPGWMNSSRLPAAVALASVLIATLLIFWCYRDLSTTWDEPAHIGPGMQWLSKGDYDLDVIDPPLPRVSTAIGPYLLGIRSFGKSDPYDEGNQILTAHGNAQLHRVLTAARLGILPYFFIAAFLTWRITRRWLGPWPAAMAVFLFATCPPVLAHASLATTDITFTATFLLAIYLIWRAFLDPRPWRCTLAGVAFGLACISKLSAAPYLVLCGCAFLVYVLSKKRIFPRAVAWLVFFVAAAVTIWAGYHFSVGSLASANPKSHQTLQHTLERFGPASGVVAAVVNHVPANPYFQGLHFIMRMKKYPPPGYLFGQLYYGGRWYFYPVILLLKTPIPFMLLVLAGSFYAIRRLVSGSDEFALVPLVAISGPILVATMSHINLGVRHVLVAYPFFAMLAALAAVELYRRFQNSRKIVLSTVVLLLGWQFVSCMRSAPDFLTYFIEPAASRGGYIAIDSDYDWGQDLFRLRDKLKELHASDVAIAYSGSVDMNSYGLPEWRRLPDNNQPVKGWVVVSETMLRANPGQYGWVTQYEPVADAGKTLHIYHIE